MYLCILKHVRYCLSYMNYVHICLGSAFNNKSCDFKFNAIDSSALQIHQMTAYYEFKR
jgi:hypothetical protein